MFTLCDVLHKTKQEMQQTLQTGNHGKYKKGYHLYGETEMNKNIELLANVFLSALVV